MRKSLLLIASILSFIVYLKSHEVLSIITGMFFMIAFICDYLANRRK